MDTVDMFAGIDGTGPYSNKDYRAGFENSFVNKFTNNGPGDTQFYFRGPGALGTSSIFLAKMLYLQARGQFEAHYAKNKYLKIMLAGYSRGGVVACAAAKYLNDHDIPVHALFLFDPVDRTETLWGKDTIIPKNVSFVYRSQRKSSTSSRESFSTDCTEYWDGRKIQTNWFSTTHGGMGGCPWENKGEAKYYTFSTGASIARGVLNSSTGGAFYTPSDGYFTSPPLGGKLDHTKKTLICEGGIDGLTTLSPAEEKTGCDAARADYTRKLSEIRSRAASTTKLKVYQDALARKERDRKTVSDFRRETNTGRNWQSTKGGY